MNRTRIVRWLRVLLPLMALAILSMLFLLSPRSDTEPRIPYADVDAEAMANDPRFVAPRYSAVTDDGAELSLRAAQAAPVDGNSSGTASNVMLDWVRPDGLRATLTAPDAVIDRGVIRLRGGVRMATSTGWTLTSDRVDAATDRSDLSATDTVRAESPFGRITADRMQLLPQGGAGTVDAHADRGAILNFSGRVRLLYQPQPPTEDVP